jgi:hypothetical protein
VFDAGLDVLFVGDNIVVTMGQLERRQRRLQI